MQMTREAALKVAKPILFNTDMVRAIQDGRKTETRRVVKFLGKRNPNWTGYVKDGLNLYNGTNEVCNKKPPYKVGDILYVRETWCESTDWEDDALPSEYLEDILPIYYRADYEEGTRVLARWRPSIHMPKEAARIFLRVTDVRVERLQDITDEQIVAEGCNIPTTASDEERCLLAFARFPKLWNSTIKKSDLAKYGWAANPWVWVIEFEKLEVTE